MTDTDKRKFLEEFFIAAAKVAGISAPSDFDVVDTLLSNNGVEVGGYWFGKTKTGNPVFTPFLLGMATGMYKVEDDGTMTTADVFNSRISGFNLFDFTTNTPYTVAGSAAAGANGGIGADNTSWVAGTPRTDIGLNSIIRITGFFIDLSSNNMNPGKAFNTSQGWVYQPDPLSLDVGMGERSTGRSAYGKPTYSRYYTFRTSSIDAATVTVDLGVKIDDVVRVFGSVKLADGSPVMIVWTDLGLVTLSTTDEKKIMGTFDSSGTTTKVNIYSDGFVNLAGRFWLEYTKGT